VGAHHSNALYALLQKWRLSYLATLSLSFKLFDKVTERDEPLALGAPRQVGKASDVGERLHSGRPDGERGVGAGALKELSYGVGYRSPIATAVQVL